MLSRPRNTSANRDARAELTPSVRFTYWARVQIGGS
jgi:hypothetical protein